MGNTRLGLKVSLDIPGEGFRFADMGAGRQKNVHHKLRPVRARKKLLLHLSKTGKCCDECSNTKDYGHPTEAERLGQKATVGAKKKARVGIFALGPAPVFDFLEQKKAQERRNCDR